MLDRATPLALYMEGAVGEPAGKMGYGVLRYSPNPVSCVVDSKTAGRNLEDLVETPRNVPIVRSVREAWEQGARALVLGIAPPGGQMPPEWFPVMDEAVALGMGLVNGLHERLGPRYPDLQPGQVVWDVRVEPEGLGIGSAAAAKLACRRVLMIGTDMAVGKMTAGLEIVKAAREAGIRADFLATGQIGIVVWGAGVALDAVRVDFASGAIEREVLSRSDTDLLVIEGQGALIHPGSTANLPLLRGSCPTHLVLCHRAGQQTLRRLPDIQIPALKNYLRMYEDLAEACGTFPRPRTSGVALNTAGLGDDDARIACEAITAETGLPCVDPVRHGAAALVTALLNSE